METSRVLVAVSAKLLRGSCDAAAALAHVTLFGDALTYLAARAKSICRLIPYQRATSTRVVRACGDSKN